jgi:hypothetical protein
MAQFIWMMPIGTDSTEGVWRTAAVAALRDPGPSLQLRKSPICITNETMLVLTHLLWVALHLSTHVKRIS